MYSHLYPYAARRALNIGAGVKKKTNKGRRLIQNRSITLIGGFDEIIGDKLLSADELDAVISAYTAYLEANGNADKIDCIDGIIYVPKIEILEETSV